MIILKESLGLRVIRALHWGDRLGKKCKCRCEKSVQHGSVLTH